MMLYHISFLRRTNRLNYFFRLSKDGACDFRNIYNLYFGKNGFPKLYDELTERKALHRRNPVILLFDNEESKGKPLSEFKKSIGKTDIKNADIERGICIKGNLFFLTNPRQKHELNPSSDDCMIEYLIPKEAHEHKIKGKKLNLNENYSISKVEHLTKTDCLSYSNPVFDFTEILQFTDYRAYNYHLY